MDTIKIDARDVNFWYGDFHALKGISMEIEEKSVVAFIGPSGCGKSTFLRLFNRMNDLIPATRLEGEIRIDGHIFMPKGWKWTSFARMWAWFSNALTLSRKAYSRMSLTGFASME